jgi:transposase InsO family protein
MISGRRGRRLGIRCDNGPELTSRHFLAWAVEWKIDLRHIQPGKPIHNAHVQSFHRRLREECVRVSRSEYYKIDWQDFACSPVNTRKFPVESALIEPPDKHSHKRGDLQLLSNVR